MKKILIIEDEPAIRENIVELLQYQDFEAIAAINGLEGIQLAKQHKPDLIICDISMPELDGYGVLEALKQDSSTGMIPFIFLTALADKPHTRKGMELGADDYLTKPCKPLELMNAIQARLEKQAYIHQQQTQKLEELRHSITLSLPHELRTPLNGILGFSQILLDELAAPEQAELREMVESIHSSGQRLYRLIHNFLLYADLELIGVSPQRITSLQNHSIDHPDVVITEQAIQQAENAGREGDLHLYLQQACVRISANLLKKIVEELIDNAFKFSMPQTPVYVTGKVDQQSFIVSVTDQGRGMKTEQIENLGAYLQFDRKLYEQQGSGLGLALATRLANLHGGSLTLESIPNQQTTVTVVLPLAIGLNRI